MIRVLDSMSTKAEAVVSTDDDLLGVLSNVVHEHLIAPLANEQRMEVAEGVIQTCFLKEELSLQPLSTEQVTYYDKILKTVKKYFY